MQIKKEPEPPEKPKTDGKTNYKTTITNTLPSLKCVSHTSCFECKRHQEEEKKWMQENTMSIFQAKCKQCHHSDFGRKVDDCIHSNCAIWKYRGCEIVEYLGIEKGCTGFVATTNLNKTRGDDNG